MMADFELDCRGLVCPEPVIRTKRALAEGKKSLKITVDNETARDNVSRFARTSGCAVDVSEIEGGFVLSVTKAGATADESVAVKADEKRARRSGSVILVTADEIGKGERELGTTLMKSFLYACVEADEVPATMIFMNSGVRLVTENDETITHLKTLEDRGVDIIACGTCLDYYSLKERLAAGRVGNMYEIQTTLIGADNLVAL